MKRDMELVRKVLFAVEEHSGDPRGWIDIELPEYSKDQISYHIMLLDSAGLIEAEDISCLGVGGYEWKARALTWSGHEFVENARNDTIWKTAKEVAAKAGGVGFDVFKDLLVACAKQYLKETLGLAAA